MPAPNPETGAAISDESSAVDHVSSLLESGDGPTEQEETVQPASTLEEESQESAQEAEGSSEEDAQTEPEGESEELPDSLEGLAEALGMDPADLAGHLKVSVPVNGKMEALTLAEAMKGYQREADYHGKNRELAEQRRQHEATAAQASERWQQQVQALHAAIQSLEGEMETGPSAEQLAQLMDDDPSEYLRVTARQQAQKDRLAAAKQTRDGELTAMHKEASERFAAFRTEQQRVLSEKMPEVSDPKKLAAFETGSQTYLAGLGYSAEEIGGFFSGAYDHRHVLIIRDAMKFRALQEGQKTLPKKLQNLARVQKPGGATREKSDTDKLAASSNRLRQLKSKGTRQQQERAALERVKMML